jgi:DNA-binding NtrC family response regulator
MQKKITILIIDAEQNSCEEMQEFLLKEGFNILCAKNAVEGRLRLESRKIDTLILDIYLPDANGLELVKEFKLKYPKMEVIIISGFGDLNTVIEAMHLGVLDFLKKPLRQSDLKVALERSRKTAFHDHIIQ